MSAARGGALALLVLALTCAPPLPAQAHPRPRSAGPHRAGATTPHESHAADPAVARFVEQARAGTRRYHDRAAAITAGYRQIGPDFPGMGEHWINLGAVFAAALDPARPAVLEYVTVDGAPRLVGVAYLRPLVGDERAPTFPAPGAWHDHAQSIDEESVLIDHAVSGARPGGGRVAMLHAWVWLHNPAGTFATDNWALPFVRAGMPAPAAPPPRPAAQALSLLSGGDAYYASLLAAVGRPHAADSAVIVAALADARRAAAGVVGAPPRAALAPAQLDALAAAWHRARSAIAAGVRPEVAERLRGLAAP